jgi:hypothetical protein
MRSFRGATGAFLPEARALCSHAVLGATARTTAAMQCSVSESGGTVTLSDGSTLRLREAQDGETPLCWGYPNGRKTGYAEDKAAQ